jgi:hypothetical protein
VAASVLGLIEWSKRGLLLPGSSATCQLLLMTQLLLPLKVKESVNAWKSSLSRPARTLASHSIRPCTAALRCDGSRLCPRGSRVMVRASCLTDSGRAITVRSRASTRYGLPRGEVTYEVTTSTWPAASSSTIPVSLFDSAISEGSCNSVRNSLCSVGTDLSE